MNLFTGSTHQIGETLEQTNDEYWKLRKWQIEAFNILKNEIYITINAPTGAGKSMLMQAISWSKLTKNKKLRICVAAPQTIIGSNLAKKKLFVMPGTNEKVYWFAGHDYCNPQAVPGTERDGEEISKSTIRAVIQWLDSSHGHPQGRILVASNATWVGVYQELASSGRLDLLDNLLFWVDEAHHLKSFICETEFGIRKESNGIGGLVDYLATASPSRNIQVGIASATLRRSDSLSLLAGEAFQRFNGPQSGSFVLGWDRYLKMMNYLKTFRFDFILCGTDYTESVHTLVRENRKDIVYIPTPMSKASLGDKYGEAETIISSYHKVRGGKRTNENGLDILNRGKNKTIIMNLVDEDLRPIKKDYIRDCINESKDALDAIVAMSMFKEGADWVYADRSIIVGVRNSSVDMQQIIGRLFRDVEGKEEVQIIQLLPFSLDRLKLSEDEFRDNLNSFLKFIFASMLIQDILQPTRIASPKSEREPRGKKSEELGDPDRFTTEDWATIKTMAAEICLSLPPGDWADETNYKIYEARIAEVLKDYGIKQNDIGAYAKMIWKSFPKHNFKEPGIDLSDVPFDIIKKTNPLGFLLRYTSEACGISTWAELRKALQIKDKDVGEKHMEEVQSVGEVKLTKKAKKLMREMRND